MKHKDKVKLARKLRTRREEEIGVSIFQTKAWEARKQAIADRVKRTEARQKEMARKRRERLKE